MCWYIKLSVLVEAATTAQNRSTWSCDSCRFFGMKSWLQDEGQRQSGEAGIILELRAEIPSLIWLNPFSNLKMQHPWQLLGNFSLTFRLTCGCAIMLIRPVILAAAIGTQVAHIHWDGPWNLEWRQQKLHRQLMTTFHRQVFCFNGP